MSDDCDHCKDKVKFGGPGRRRQSCLQRKCKMMSSVTGEPAEKVAQTMSRL